MIYVLYDVLNQKEISEHRGMEAAVDAFYLFISEESNRDRVTGWMIKDEITGELRNLTPEEYKEILICKYDLNE